MVNVYSQSGKIVLRNGKVATSNSCCCKSCLCCDLSNTDIIFTGQSVSVFTFSVASWSIYVLEDCPYAGQYSPGGVSSAVGLSAVNTGFEELTFYIQIYCDDTPDMIEAVYTGNAIAFAGGALGGSATDIPITSASTACVQNGTVDVSIGGDGNATINIKP